MNENIPNKNTSEELDLGQVFKLIGNGFNRFFRFIGNILKGIFDITIQFILFIRRHFIKFTIATLLGVGIGFFLDTRREVVYIASLIVQPNFGSATQLYKNIQYYNSLVEQEDTLLLASTFGITPKEAASLRAFYINPIQNENSTLEAYNKLLRQAVDSTTSEKYTYEDFKKNISEYDYSVHEIKVLGLKNNIFRKLQPVIIESIKENNYFNTKRTITLENLNRSDSILRSSIEAIDTLRNVYMKVLLAEARKETPQGTTSIVLSENNKKNNELELFNTKIKFKNELNENDIQRAENSEVINIVSNFQPVGYKVSILYQKYYFVFGITGFAIMLLSLVIREFNTFLNAYQKQKNQLQ
jgi:hypothetical protein